MGRFHVKKQDTFIDMTPMSDVMVLLLTFFMLTATFTKEEPVKVNVPRMVSDIKIPVRTTSSRFMFRPQGKVFMNMDNPTAQKAMAQNLVDNKKLELNSAQLKQFSEVPMFGTPLNTIKSWLESGDKRNDILQKDPNAGIPCDSTHNELKDWVTAARQANGEKMGIAIKADEKNTVQHHQRSYELTSSNRRVAIQPHHDTQRRREIIG